MRSSRRWALMVPLLIATAYLPAALAGHPLGAMPPDHLAAHDDPPLVAWASIPDPAGPIGTCSSAGATARPLAGLPNISAEGTGAWASASRTVIANNSGVNGTLPVPSAHPASNQFILLAIEDPISESAVVVVGVAETTVPILGTVAEAVAYLPNGTEVYSTSGPFLTIGRSYDLAIQHAHGDWWSLTANGQSITGGSGWENGTYDLGAPIALGVGCAGGIPLAPTFVVALYGNGVSPPTLPTTLVRRAVEVTPGSGSPPSYLPVAANALPQFDPSLGTVYLEGTAQNATLPSGSLLVGSSASLGFPGTGAPLWGSYRFHSLGNVTLSPRNVTLSSGSQQVFRAAPFDIDGSALAGVRFSWQVSPTVLGTLNATSGGSVTFTAGTLGGRGVLSVNASFNCSSISVQTNLTVAAGNGPPILSFTAVPDAVMAGASSNLTVQTGAWPRPISYAYTDLPPGCASQNASEISCRPTATGTFQPTVFVNDSTGLSSRASTSLAVYPTLTITSFAAAPNPATSGQRVNLTVQATGGVPPLTYSFQGLPQGCPQGPGQANFSCLPAATPGTWQPTVTVNDSSVDTVSARLTLTILPSSAPLRVANFTASPNPVSTRSLVTLWANATGGRAPLGYAYTGLPPGCVSDNVSRLDCTPSASGTYTIGVAVTDRSGVRAYANLSLEVRSSPSTSSSAPSVETEWVVALVVVAVVAAGATMALWRRRRSRSRPPR